MAAPNVNTSILGATVTRHYDKLVDLRKIFFNHFDKIFPGFPRHPQIDQYQRDVKAITDGFECGINTIYGNALITFFDQIFCQFFKNEYFIIYDQNLGWPDHISPTMTGRVIVKRAPPVFFAVIVSPISRMIP